MIPNKDLRVVQNNDKEKKEDIEQMDFDYCWGYLNSRITIDRNDPDPERWKYLKDKIYKLYRRIEIHELFESAYSNKDFYL